MKHSFVDDEFNHVNNYVVKDMWVLGTKIIPESGAILSTMIVTLTFGKSSKQYRANIYSNILMSNKLMHFNINDSM
jgi:hypothetical protein